MKELTAVERTLSLFTGMTDREFPSRDGTEPDPYRKVPRVIRAEQDYTAVPGHLGKWSASGGRRIEWAQGCVYSAYHGNKLVGRAGTLSEAIAISEASR